MTTKKTGIVVAGVLLLAGVVAALTLGAVYSPVNAGAVYQPGQGATQYSGSQQYGWGGMMGGYGRGGMMGWSRGYQYSSPGAAQGVGPGSGIGGMWQWCANWMRSWQGGTQQTNQINMFGYGFAPQVVTVKVGTTLTWVNVDSVNHSVDSGTSANPTSLFDSGDIAPGQSFSYTFAQAGTYTYYCDLHEGMVGVVIVQP